MRKPHLNSYILSIVFVISFVYLFQSCSDNAAKPDTKPESNKTQSAQLVMPTVQDNALSFKSRKDFNGFMQKLHKKPSNKLNAFVKSQAKGFTSLKQIQDQIRQKNSGKFKTSSKTSEILQLNIQDPNFASILNENGVFQINQQVFKITNKYTYIFKNRDAFETYDFTSNKKMRGVAPTYVAPDPCHGVNQQVTQLNNNAYRVQNCGGGGGGGGYDPGDDDNDRSYPNPEVQNLDPSADLDIDYASERTEEYSSGGTEGRLRGSSWNQNFYVYSSVGTKSKHERHTWGKWWDRTAEKITLDTFIDYSYGEKNINFFALERSLKVKLADIANLIGVGLDQWLWDIRNTTVGSVFKKYVFDPITQTKFKVLVKKTEDERFTYNIAPTNIQKVYSHSKSDAKKIRKVFDWSTAIVSFPPGIKDKAVDFKLEILRAKHTLKHDGYHIGFITDKRE